MRRLATLVLIAACSKEAPPPPVHVGPEEWLEAIARAKQQIEIETSRFGDSRVTPAIEQIARSGVTVHILVDKSTIAKDADTLARLVRAGAVVRSSEGLATYVVVDGMDTVIGDVELGLRIPDLAVGRQARALFGPDWALAVGDPPPAIETTATALPLKLAARPATQLPANVSDADPLVVALLAGAKSQIAVAGLFDGPISAAITAAIGRGVKIRQLARPGVEANHTVMIIVDGARAWFASGGETGRSIGVQVDDPVVVAQLAAVFDATFGH